MFTYTENRIVEVMFLVGIFLAGFSFGYWVATQTHAAEVGQKPNVCCQCVVPPNGTEVPKQAAKQLPSWGCRSFQAYGEVCLYETNDGWLILIEYDSGRTRDMFIPRGRK